HNRRRGSDSAWVTAMAAIDTLRSLEISVEISAVISEENEYELEHLARFCQQSGCQLLVRPLVTIGRAATICLAESFWERVQGKVRKLLDQFPGVLVDDRF